eukprot:CAMPEP_0113480152 /NCGR_PEP_ID=MMETSP0014_2-20120614/21717_1 /TAXON_ID=2857 /ORGANISM="Nitzschia sp." /LENGTH=710 /DNA_ID=CAMNT_0000373551 /DNA_START=89 /DNA_END=2217 /DNA_ORIENTATION=+ /assembly_acc=CAM_ASM_000159
MNSSLIEPPSSPSKKKKGDRHHDDELAIPPPPPPGSSAKSLSSVSPGEEKKPKSHKKKKKQHHHHKTSSPKHSPKKPKSNANKTLTKDKASAAAPEDPPPSMREIQHKDHVETSISIRQKETPPEDNMIKNNSNSNNATAVEYAIVDTTKHEIDGDDDDEEGQQQHRRRSRRSTLFAVREGHTLKFTGLTLKTRVRKKKNKEENAPEPKIIVNNLSGHVPPKKVTAIMGPSGAGKTSLLKILTGRVSKSKMDLSGQVFLDGFEVDPSSIVVRREIAYVEQEVSLLPTTTTREAIMFSARLRLGRHKSHQELQDVTNEILQELGLNGCADTMVGGGLIKGGLSGGEKKRCQCGVELVTSPGIIILDEPTSGLDSFSAEQLVDVLRRIANAGASVLITIHQPPPTIVRKIDHLVLLENGKMMYDGDMGEPLDVYFEEKGYGKPADYNVADWILNVAQTISDSDLEKAGFFVDNAFSKINDESIYNSTREQEEEHLKRLEQGVQHAAWWTQISLLFDREMKRLYRDKMSMVIRLGSTAFFGLFYGLIYLNIGREDLNDPLIVQSIFGAIANTLISMMFGVAQSALSDLPRDRPVFLREYSTNHYGILPYFVSRFSVECVVTLLQSCMQLLTSYWLFGLNMGFFVFLTINFILAMASTSMGVMMGSAIEDPSVAAEFMPLLIVPQLLFSGFFIPTEFIPSFLRWAQYLCSLTYA